MDIYTYGQRRLYVVVGRAAMFVLGVGVGADGHWTPVTRDCEMKVGVALIRSPTCLTYPSLLGESDKVLIQF